MDLLQNIDVVQCCQEIDKFCPEALSSQEMLKDTDPLKYSLNVKFKNKITEICSFSSNSSDGFEESANSVRSIFSKLTSISYACHGGQILLFTYQCYKTKYNMSKMFAINNN